jgi:hypothetical protein
MIRTKKKSSPVSVVDSAWDAFFAQKVAKVYDPEELRKEGWISLKDFQERTGLPNTTARSVIKKEGIESQAFCVIVAGRRRDVIFIHLPA